MEEELNIERLESITQRLFYFLEKEGLSDADFATTIGVGAPVISHMRKGRNKMSLKVYAKILENYPKLNQDWLLSGKGNLYKGDMKQAIAPNLFSPSTKKEEVFTKSNPPLEKEPEVVRVIKNVRSVERIIVFYTDGSFQELTP